MSNEYLAETRVIWSCLYPLSSSTRHSAVRTIKVPSLVVLNPNSEDPVSAESSYVRIIPSKTHILHFPDMMSADPRWQSSI